MNNTTASHNWNISSTAGPNRLWREDSTTSVIDRTFGKYKDRVSMTETIAQEHWSEIAEECTVEELVREAGKLVERAYQVLVLAGYK